MSFIIQGLAVEPFQQFFTMSDADLGRHHIVRRTASAKPGFPCRVTLEDAEPGESLLLMNFEHHATTSPYRSSYAIYVRENAVASQFFENECPPVFLNRPMAFRAFDKESMLIDAALSLTNNHAAVIEKLFINEAVVYIDAHNAAHGCFAARVNRAIS